ncbi:hypothetical protein HYR69_10260 [Candidatus Sumerlaeota bacterium]|nr:hypothetical protein [Candidatus Sumerlaeota bacterium]
MAAVNPAQIGFKIEGLRRNAIVYPNRLPAPKAGAPLLLVFHGHGGNTQRAANKFQIHEAWPQAVVVYLQGTSGVRGVIDPDGLDPGWQKNPGDVDDRDVKFVDRLLEEIPKQYKIDPARIYALGHSNGARFVNVLWNMRGEKFAAFCSACSQGGEMIASSKPKPILMIMGEQDRIVPYETQKRSIPIARELLKSDSAKARTDGYLRVEQGEGGNDLATFIHPWGHDWQPKFTQLAINFFNRHSNLDSPK